MEVSSLSFPFLCVLLICLTCQSGLGRSQLVENESVNSFNTSIESDVTWGEDLDPGLVPVAEVYLASENENLTLLSKDGNSEILISQEMLRNSKEFQNVILVCNAYFPIQWIYQGDGVKIFKIF